MQPRSCEPWIEVRMGRSIADWRLVCLPVHHELTVPQGHALNKPTCASCMYALLLHKWERHDHMQMHKKPWRCYQDRSIIRTSHWEMYESHCLRNAWYSYGCLSSAASNALDICKRILSATRSCWLSATSRKPTSKSHISYSSQFIMKLCWARQVLENKQNCNACLLWVAAALRSYLLFLDIQCLQGGSTSSARMIWIHLACWPWNDQICLHPKTRDQPPSSYDQGYKKQLSQVVTQHLQLNPSQAACS